MSTAAGDPGAGAPVPGSEATVVDAPDPRDPSVVSSDPPVAAEVAEDPWPSLQARFVDDPAAAVAEAAGLVDQALDGIRSRAAAHVGGGDTEALRLAFHRFRELHRDLWAVLARG